MTTTLENISDKKYSVLINEIEQGQVKIPQFQRKFVWSIKASAKLLDSIMKGYPIGTFIYCDVLPVFCTITRGKSHAI